MTVFCDTSVLVAACLRSHLTPEMYDRAIEVCAARGLGGGKVYDALLLECARESKAGRIYTFNLGDFRKLAPDLAERIVAP